MTILTAFLQVNKSNKHNIMRLLIQVKAITGIILFGSLLISTATFGQSFTSSIGDRQNIGLYGGPATDLSYSNTNQRLFAAVHSPATLFYTDDTCKTWFRAFQFDSLEYDFETRGWGGGASRVLTNNIGWVTVQTGISLDYLSSSVISYDNGNSFQTAFDPYLLNILTSDYKDVSAIGLSDHFMYAALGNYLLRTNDTTTFGTNQLLINMDTIPDILPGSYISSIAVANDISGYPVYFVIEDPSSNNRYFKFYGTVLIELNSLPANLIVKNIYTHPGQISGDTAFISCLDEFTGEYQLFRTTSGGFFWDNITPFAGLMFPLNDADYSMDWVPMMPFSNGLRLSITGGLISDDLGDTWQGPAFGLSEYGIVTHPINIDLIVGSNHIGTAISNAGIFGTFQNAENINFTNVNVNDFDEVQDIYYVATDAGLAYTEEYFNPLINGYEQWIQPNGLFPVPNAGDEDGVSAVAIDPYNNQHVVCGFKNGFCVTFNGATDFIYVLPPNWNTNGHLDLNVTDILFANSNTILAVTGLKHKKMEPLPAQPVGNIWRSLDGGLTWNIVTPSFPDEYQMGNCLAIGEVGPVTIIYSGTGYKDEIGQIIDGALWNSLDFGDTWNKVNDAPNFAGSPPLPIFDIDLLPFSTDIMYLSSDMVLARSDDGGLNYFISDIPYNKGSITSSLIDPLFPDSIAVTIGRHLYKYNFLIDDADMKFKGYPGEFFTSSNVGSVLGGSNTGGSKIIEAPTHLLDIKVYIEGPFNGTDLNTTLNTSGYLPLNQPFNQPPWNYDGTESVVSIPNSDVVDWILIELRKTTGDPSTATINKRIERQALLLLKDGTLVDDDGFTNPRFSIILSNTKDSDKIHGVVYSPSHVSERTSSEMSQAKSYTFSYDYTTGPEQAYGGSSAHKELAPGIWGMISGDGNHDGQVDNEDKNEVWLEQNGNTGYYFGDFNRDGNVDITDLTDFWKPNTGAGSKIE